MQAFQLVQPGSAADAVTATQAQGSKYIAGGSVLMQLMKDNVEVPTQLVDLDGIGLSGIRTDGSGLRLEGMARMSEVAAHPAVRQRWPMICEALLASASPQVRSGQDHVEAVSSVRPGEEEKRYAMHAFGAQFVEVRVDADLGTIHVSRIVGAFDGGRIINSKTA